MLARGVSAFLVRTAALRCRAILTISNFSKKEIITLTGCAEHKVFVTHLAAEELFCNPLSAEEIRSRLTPILPSDGPYILCIANSYPHKNLPALVEAYCSLGRKIRQRLIIVGKPGRGEQRLRFALRASEPGRVVRLAGLDRLDLALETDVFLL